MRAALLLLLLGAGCFSKPERFEGTDPTPDAPVVTVDAPPANLCTPQRCSGTCASDGFCELVGSNSAQPQRCPDGLRCRVLCSDGKCKGGVDCGNAIECDVQCDGRDTCKDGGVDCGNAAICNVECEGDNACQGMSFPAVDCRGSQCQVECDGRAACQKGVRSTGGTCTAACCGDPATCQESDGSCTQTAQCD